MLATLKRLLEERARVWEAAKAINDAADTESRSALTGEEQAAWDTAMADLSTLDKRITGIRAAMKADGDLEEARALVGAAAPPAADSEQRSLDQRVEAFFRGTEGRAIAVTFGDAEVRDLTKGTSAAGGATVPTSFVRQLYAHLVDNSAIRQTNVRVITTASGEDLDFPKTTAHTSAALVAEGNPIGESDPTFGKVTLGAFKYANLVQHSSELLSDTGVDLLGYLAEDAGRALANASGAHYVTGDGTAKPRGVQVAATAGKTGAVGQTTSVTADDLIDLYFSIIAPYRRNGFWLLNDATVAKLRKLKDADNQYLWQPGLTAGDPDLLLGRPVVADPNMPVMAASAKSVLFGDFSRYLIRDVGSVRIERSDDYAFNADLVTWRFVMRTDGDLLDETGAIKAYVNSAT